MQDYQREFIEFLVASEVLTFGDFTTKSGRKTPYFINTGRYHTGSQLSRLAGFYAQTILDRWGANAYDVLFGPAYKGIPLAVATAMDLARRGHDTAFCFNRKEAKDHGEGGVLIGKKLSDGDRVLIIEDVTTAGTSIRETVPVLKAAADVSLAGLVVSVDRMERGSTDQTALSELSVAYAMPTAAIVTIDDIVTHLKEHRVQGELLIDTDCDARIRAYRAEYGPRA
jgi:orotate phosphoribosyltransferase